MEQKSGENLVSKTNKILQIIRDVLIIFLSFVVTTTTPLWKFYVLKQSVEVEPVFYVLIGLFAFMSFLSLINLLLIIFNVKNRFYYYFYTIFLMIPSIIIAGLGAWYIILPFLILNIFILITLRKKKEESKK